MPPGLSLKLRFGGLLFDDKRVVRAMDAVKRQAQGRAGGYIRKVARNSIRTRPRNVNATPGQPYFAHSSKSKLILFGWDPSAESTVIGVVPFARATGVPELLEHAGTVVRRHRRGKRRYRYRGNPVMAPALRIAIDQGAVPNAWRNSIRT